MKTEPLNLVKCVSICRDFSPVILDELERLKRSGATAAPPRYLVASILKDHGLIEDEGGGYRVTMQGAHVLDLRADMVANNGVL